MTRGHFITGGYYTKGEGDSYTKTTTDCGAASEGGAPVNAGTYYVKIDVPEDDVYMAVTAYMPITISQATGTVSNLSITGWTYGMYDQAANSPTAESNSDATAEYKYKVKDTEDTTYTEAVPQVAGTYILKVTYPATTNYTEATTTTEFTIARKTVTPSITGTAQKTYDGTTGVEAGDLTISLTGVVSGDEAKVGATADYAYASANAGTGIAVTASNIALTGDAAGNYVLSPATCTGTGSITAKDLTGEMVTSPQTTYYYTGSAIEPAVTVSDAAGGTELLQASDYEVTYAENTTVGNNAGTITVTGKGNYTGTITKNFTIAYVTAPTDYIQGTQGSNGWYTSDVTIAAADWKVSQNGTAYTQNISVTTEGNNDLTLYFKNAQGQITEAKTETIKIDKTAPTGSITIKTSTWDSFLHTITFGFYTTEKEQITVASQDASGSGVAATQYWIASTRYTETTELVTAAGESWTAYSGGSKPRINQNSTNIVYAKITDNAGNVTYLSSADVLHDNVAPVITSMTAPNDSLKDVTATVTATVTEAGSGIDRVYLYYSVTEADVTGADTNTIKTQGVPSTDGTFNLIGLTSNTTYYYVALATDKAGNVSTIDTASKGNFTTAKTAIAGTVSITGNAVYNQTLTATTSVTTPNPGAITYSWYRNGSAEAFLTGTGDTYKTYTLTQADMGKTITVKVSAENCSGTLDKVTTAVAKAGCPTANVPTDGTVTASGTSDATFTFKGIAGVTYEYSLDGGTTWTDLGTLDAPTVDNGLTGKIRIGNNAYAVGKVQVRAKATDLYKESSIVSNATAFTASLEGSVAITGTTKYNETLTATATGVQSNASVTFTWYREGNTAPIHTTNKGTDRSDTYVLQSADIGKTITVKITATGYTGEQVSAATTVIQKADGREITGTVTGTSSNDGKSYSYTITVITGAEYSKDNSNWQTSNVFTGITPGTTGTFYARMKETAEYQAGIAKNTGAVTFAKLTPAAPALAYTIDRTNPDNIAVTITPVTGAEYSFDGGSTFSAAEGANRKDGYTTSSTVTLAIRLVATATHNQSSNATATVNLAKETQAAPAAFTLAYTANGETDYTVIIPALAGCEYSFDGSTYTDTNTKTGVAVGTTVTGYRRFKENDDYNASTAASSTVTLPRFTVKTPVLTPNGGEFTDSTSVTISCGTENAAIYYTTDGTTPDSAGNGTKYTGAITISSTTTVKAVAVKENLLNSATATAQFTKKTNSSGSTTGNTTTTPPAPTTTPTTPTPTPTATVPTTTPVVPAGTTTPVFPSAGVGAILNPNVTEVTPTDPAGQTMVISGADVQKSWDAVATQVKYLCSSLEGGRRGSVSHHRQEGCY